MNKNTKIIFFGAIGSYCYIAAKKYFQSKINLIGQPIIEKVFDEINIGNCLYGVVPIENSTTGSITETYDLLLKKKLYISGEIYLRIHHHLWAIAAIDIRKIKKCYSHSQALNQCSEFFRKYPWIETCVVCDTATAINIISHKNNITYVAIGSKEAAAIYGLENIDKNIEDNPDNYTRFVVVAKKRNEKGRKISLVFSVKHLPGSLFKALKPYAKYGLNLTKIESRPIIGKPWEYLFFLDFEINGKEKEVIEVLKKMRQQTLSLTILGRYSKGEVYET